MKVDILNRWEGFSLRKVVYVFILVLVCGLVSPAFGVSEEEEERLLEKALLESAVTPGQKQAIANYLRATATAKRTRASELRELAKLSRGEKFLQARVRKEKLFKMADSLDRQAERHEAALKEFQIESH
ncbi:LIC10421/LIC12816 family protein [Leptospira yasudae]|uniref:Uncharacterized protein n=1 Tax=Leptospira yasudae TaxID=2202201 RepID=A0A5F2E583_9LEPT|nr:hypothetical protein [Leptospira yasudae]MBW0433700.1 hypothetical protein [Leptospira yasudae]TGL79136.1 hypothetical protein EHQ72_09195 [Leptospira yasudae]TGL83116.1 hypothetical protein EHQ77_02360 [Leptospira yasudae]TGL85653.1 hypothetical protein EHQ83_07325 [Leptospira yasudae]TGM96998.1 hypothetical protein EHR10_14630 [Leptospira yasudae]